MTISVDRLADDITDLPSATSDAGGHVEGGHVHLDYAVRGNVEDVDQARIRSTVGPFVAGPWRRSSRS